VSSIIFIVFICYKKMSTLGFSSASFKPQRATNFIRGPPNPRFQAFYDEAKRKRQEALAAQSIQSNNVQAVSVEPPKTTVKRGAPLQKTSTVAPTLKQAQPPIQQRATTRNTNTQTGGGGIEATISHTKQLAETAHTAIAAIKGDVEQRVKGLELNLAGVNNVIIEMKDKLNLLEEAARDAWFTSFWMFGDVVVKNTAIYDAEPPSGNMKKMLFQGDSVLLVGDMVHTAAGPAMRTREVDELGQISVGWVLLRDDRGNPNISNFQFRN